MTPTSGGRNNVHHLLQLRNAGAHCNSSGVQDELSLQECLAAVGVADDIMRAYSVPDSDVERLRRGLQAAVCGAGGGSAVVQLSEDAFVTATLEAALCEFQDTVGLLICHFYHGKYPPTPPIKLCGGKSLGVVEWLQNKTKGCPEGDGKRPELVQEWGTKANKKHKRAAVPGYATWDWDKVKGHLARVQQTRNGLSHGTQYTRADVAALLAGVRRLYDELGIDGSRYQEVKGAPNDRGSATSSPWCPDSWPRGSDAAGHHLAGRGAAHSVGSLPGGPERLAGGQEG